jgi:hypothetical protein
LPKGALALMALPSSSVMLGRLITSRKPFPLAKLLIAELAM